MPTAATSPIRAWCAQAHMEAAIDKIRDKFGVGALQKGIALRKPQR